MQNPHEIVERYLEPFNETDVARRRELLDALYTSNSTYTDPQVEVRGPEQIDGFIAMTQERFPGFTFKLGGPIDAHHDQARFQWHGGPAEDPDRYIGFDVIVADDGRSATSTASWMRRRPPEAPAGHALPPDREPALAQAAKCRGPALPVAARVYRCLVGLGSSVRDR